MRQGSDLDAVLFDLGGVLVGFEGPRRLQRWHPGRSAEELAERWLRARSVRRFERGRIGVDAFLTEVSEEFGLGLDLDDARREMLAWVTGPLPGALELLEQLAHLPPERRPRIGCLSNTNALHAERLRRELAMDRLFDAVFLSNETGRVKPDPEAFLEACRGLGAPLRRTLLLDDHPTNIAAARRLGLRAELVTGPAGCAAALGLDLSAGRGGDAPSRASG